MDSHVEQNKAIVRRAHEAISSGNPDALVQLLTPDYVDHSTPPGLDPGPEGARQVLAMFLSAFPDLQIWAEDLVAEGDRGRPALSSAVPTGGTSRASRRPASR